MRRQCINCKYNKRSRKNSNNTILRRRGNLRPNVVMGPKLQEKLAKLCKLGSTNVNGSCDLYRKKFWRVWEKN